MTMIEKVARALDPSLWEEIDKGAVMPATRTISLDAARRAIEAMRVPSDKMSDILNSPREYTAEWLYDAAIDAALNEEGGDAQ